MMCKNGRPTFPARLNDSFWVVENLGVFRDLGQCGVDVVIHVDYHFKDTVRFVYKLY
jgi:hypothetical protein